MNFFANVAIFLIVFVAPQASAGEYPALVAKIYPGAVAMNMKAGKVARCGHTGNSENTFCFLTKDPVSKVREFYAREGVKLEPITVNKNFDGSRPDGLSTLEGEANLSFKREGIGEIYAAPVEYHPPPKVEGTTEDEHFNTVIVMAGKAKEKLSGSAQTNKAVLLEDAIFKSFVLTPESAPFQHMLGRLPVDPDRLVPLYNKHAALRGGVFFKTEGVSSLIEINLGKLVEKRIAGRMDEKKKRNDEDREERAAIRKLSFEERQEARAARREKRKAERNNKSEKPEDLETPDEKVKVIDAYLDELEKEAYSTLIMIQMSEESGVTKDTATVQGKWKTAFRP